MKFDNVYFRLDGDTIEDELINQFSLRSQSRNLRYSKSKGKDVLDFVGFIISKKDILVSLPKNYTSMNKLVLLDNSDIELLFEVLTKDIFLNSESYFGNISDYESSYPFKCFFDIYEYYQKYGVFHETVQKIEVGYGSKISWKDTLQKSSKIVEGNNILFAPFYIKKSYPEYVFISQCMIFVINYSIKNFPFFLKFKPIVVNNLNINFLINRDAVIHKLNRILACVYKDIDRNLIKSLIHFFKEINEGGKISFKLYNFELVWEHMVNKYLNEYFIGMDEESSEEDFKLLFSNKKLNIANRFSKQKFYINKFNHKHRIEPDHYFKLDGQQFIFDSKYYNKLINIDYKQVAYHSFLKNLTKTKPINVLFLPTTTNNRQKPYFELDTEYYLKQNDKLIIYSYYMNTKSLMLNYLD